MTKRKTEKVDKIEKVQQSTKILKYIAWSLAIIALALSSVVIGYYFGYNAAQSEIKKAEDQNRQKRVSAIAKIENSLKKDAPQSVNKRLQEVLEKEAKQKHKYISASHELDYQKPNKLLDTPTRPGKLSSSKPKLAIIIDDVGTKSQVNAIDKLHLALTKSFLPPSKLRPNTPALATHENFYMVHLPLEAMSFSAEEPSTLRINDSQGKISEKISEIKKLFPKVAYINNHTGSKFTANEIAMNRLIYALNTNKINFIDSRTTAETKVPKVMENFGLKYVSRDVFLDHDMDKEYVKEQIKKAVQFAKSHGTAIAIGHPHGETLEALRESKTLFNDVELVYINNIY